MINYIFRSFINFSLTYVTNMIESSRSGWIGYVSSLGDKNYTQHLGREILVEVGRPRRVYEESIKISLERIKWEV